MAKVETSRKTRFKAALAFTNQTHSMWAEKNGVGYHHLYLVLNEARESETLIEKIDRFIEDVEAKVAAA